MKRQTRLKLLAGISGALALVFVMLLCLKIPALGLDGEEFCGSCHVMEPQVETFAHSVHSINTTCGDCHLPHHLVRGSVNKAWTGAVDFAGVVRNMDPYHIHASNHAKNVIHENCVRCHNGLLVQIGDTMDRDGKYCFDCHRNTPHAVKPNMTATDNGYLDVGQGNEEMIKVAFEMERAQAKEEENDEE